MAYYLKTDEYFLVASTPVNDDENWKQVELNKLFGLIDGTIIFESQEHENEYIQTQQQKKDLEKIIKSFERNVNYVKTRFRKGYAQQGS